MATKPAAKKATNKVGDVIELKGPAFVRQPDGSVVSANFAYALNQPGEYVIGDETYTVAE